MDRAPSQAIAEQTTDWSARPLRENAGRAAPRSLWQRARDPLFTLAAVLTILACVFGIGPFERPEGSHETFLASSGAR